MTKIEKIILALDDPSRTMRARYMFELFEEERVIGVEVYKSWKLDTDVKFAMIKKEQEEIEEEEKREKGKEEAKKNKAKKQKKKEKKKEEEEDDEQY